MVKVDESFQVRLKQGKMNFELLVDFNKLNEFKKNQQKISIYDVLVDEKIFSNQKKGEVAPKKSLDEVFFNKNKEEILKEILLKGECQVPTSYLNKLREQKKIKIIHYIIENAINPQTKTKFTPTMIELQINKLKFNFNANLDTKTQAEEIIELLRKVMPISCEKIIFEISIPAQFCGNFYGPFRKYGKIKKEYFDKENNLRLHLEISESQIDEVANYIKNNSNNEGSYFVSK